MFPDVSNASSAADKVMTDPVGGPNRNPYLTAKVSVYEQLTNTKLAETTTVLPVAFGGCCGCHLQVAADNGADPTPLGSFQEMGRLHERDSGINIAQLDPDGDGTSARCAAPCAIGTPPWARPRLPADMSMALGSALPVSEYSFSKVLHRWHVENSTVLSYDADLATNCYNCHPGNGVNCYRGHHSTKDGSGPNGELWCTDCHGDLHQRVAEGQLENPWSADTCPPARIATATPARAAAICTRASSGST